MKTFPEFITEIFDSSYDFTGPTRPSNITTIYKFTTDDNKSVDVRFYDRGKKKFEVEFTTNGRLTAIGTGDAFKIFSTVKKIILVFIQNNDIEKLVFGAEKSEPTRVKLYKRLIKSLPYKYRETQNKSQGTTVFTLEV